MTDDERHGREHLKEAERETVILISDSDRTTATVTTLQAKVVRLLERHPDAVKIEDISWHHRNGTQPGAVFEFPAAQIRFSRRRKARPGSHLSLPHFRPAEDGGDDE